MTRSTRRCSLLSSFLGMICCTNPKHPDRNPSMAIYENGNAGATWYTGYCFACHMSQRFTEQQVTELLYNPTCRVEMGDGGRAPHISKAKDYRLYEDNSYPLSLKEPGFLEIDFWLDICEFFSHRNIISSVVDFCKVRAVPSERALLFTHRTHDVITGAQLRYLDPDKKPKILNLDVSAITRRDLNTVQQNLYCDARLSTVTGVEQHEIVGSVFIITESYCDALAVFSECWENVGLRVSAWITSPLSTTVNQKVIGALHSLAVQAQPQSIILAYDIDVAGKDAETKITHQLQKLGHKVTRVSDRIQPHMKDASTPYSKMYLSILNTIIGDIITC